MAILRRKTSKTHDTKRYNTIVENVFNPIIASIVNDESVDITSCDLSVYAENLLRYAGMPGDSIAALKSRIVV